MQKVQKESSGDEYTLANVEQALTAIEAAEKSVAYIERAAVTADEHAQRLADAESQLAEVNNENAARSSLLSQILDRVLSVETLMAQQPNQAAPVTVIYGGGGPRQAFMAGDTHITGGNVGGNMVGARSSSPLDSAATQEMREAQEAEALANKEMEEARKAEEEADREWVEAREAQETANREREEAKEAKEAEEAAERE